MINIYAFICFMLVFIFIHMAVVIQCVNAIHYFYCTENYMNVIQCYLMLSITTTDEYSRYSICRFAPA